MVNEYSYYLRARYVSMTRIRVLRYVLFKLIIVAVVDYAMHYSPGQKLL